MRFRRHILLPLVVVVLGCAAVGLIATLQQRSDSARGAQVRVAGVKLAVEELNGEPHVLAAGIGTTAKEAALAMRGYRITIAEGFRQLGAGSPPLELLRARQSLPLLNERIDAAYEIARDGRAMTPAGIKVVWSQVEQQKVTTRALDAAGDVYAARAAFARRQATQGTVLTVLLLLCVFAFLHTRSVFEQRTVRRLFAENEILLEASRDEALTDALTGLHNRRALALDLEAQLPHATEEAGVLLALFDLDGFKGYNDTFGHAAGDELLHRLGANLSKAANQADARAYRLGGDEFCVLSQVSEAESEALIQAAIAALTDEGEGWSIGTSVGTVWVPADAIDVEAALVLADERMYSDKAVRKNTKSSLRSLAEGSVQRAADGSVGRVALMATVIAVHLDLGADEIDAIRIASGLYDIGKSAIPDSILTKDGELDDDEWAFIRKHTITGGRIAYATHERKQTAALVRSSHEHFDGNGYPDGLAGDQIPLGARVIAVCDAYNAMTSERPFRRAMSPSLALRELKNCAGSQFDPVVVDAFFASAAQSAASFRTPAPVSRAEPN